MATDNIFIKQLGLDSHRELYELDPEKVVDGLDEMDIDIQSGDAFLTVVQLRANADIRKSVGALEAGTKQEIVTVRIDGAGLRASVELEDTPSRERPAPIGRYHPACYRAAREVDGHLPAPSD